MPGIAIVITVLAPLPLAAQADTAAAPSRVDIASAPHAGPADSAAAGPDGSASRERAERRAAHGRTLARVGRSGLRSLLSSSGSLGDLRNRAGSYRMADRLEEARSAALEGRIEALGRALADPGLSREERARLGSLRRASRAELADVPAYRAAYETATLQVDALLPAGLLAGRPLFLRVRGRGHVRWGDDDGLTVLTEGVAVGPVLAAGRWIVSPGVTLARTDVDIARFQGRSGATAVGPLLKVGRVLGRSWSAAAEIVHVWSRNESVIIRPGPGGEVEVRTRGRSRSVSAKAELKGRFPLERPGGTPVSVRPRLGLFLTSTHRPPGTDGRGETGSGPSGAWESLAALRAGASLGTELGAWSPTLYLGWEEEIAGGTAALVDDPRALLVGAGVSWSWGRGRRLSVEYDLLRGLDGLRRVSDLTAVVILDG